MTATNIVKLQPWHEPAAPASAPRKSPKAPMQRQRYFLLDLHVAGFRHHGGLEHWDALKLQAPVKLIRDSGNVFDQNAISVVFEGRKIGYIPRNYSELLARMMDHGRKLTARVARIEDPEDTWEPIHLNVFVGNRRLPTAGEA